MIDYPLVIEPPDLVLIEVLEALPGRPISGERLVRPDGNDQPGLLWRGSRCGADSRAGQGEDHQAPEEVPQRRRAGPLRDRARRGRREAGRTGTTEGATEDSRRPPEDDKNPFELDEEKKPKDEAKKPHTVPSSYKVRAIGQGTRAPLVLRPLSPWRASQTAGKTPGPGREETRGTAEAGQDPTRGRWSGHHHDRGPVQGEEGGKSRRRKAAVAAARWAILSIPRNRDRVFVDITAYNSKNYYVLGDVAVPGRLPFTGNETVMDALQFAGGLFRRRNPRTSAWSGRPGAESRRGSTRSTWRRSATRVMSPPTTRSSPETAWSWAETRWSRRRSSSIAWRRRCRPSSTRCSSESSMLRSVQTQPGQHERSSRTWSSSGSRR